MTQPSRLLAIAALGCLGVACSPRALPMEPHESAVVTPRLLRPDLPSLETIETVSISGNGVTVTLNTRTLALSASDGNWITISPELAAELLASFEQVPIADATSASVASSIAAWGDPWAGCSWGGDCETLRVSDARSDGENGKRAARVQVRLAPGELNRLPARYRKWAARYEDKQAGIEFGPRGTPMLPGISRSRGNLGTALRTGPITLGSYLGYTCGQIAREALLTRSAFQATRIDLASQIRGVIASELVGAALGKYVGALAWGTIQIENLVYDHDYNTVQMSALGMMWGMAQCSPQQANVGQIIATGGGWSAVPNAPGGYEKVCSPANFQISFDNGQHWITVSGMLCVFEPI